MNIDLNSYYGALAKHLESVIKDNFQSLEAVSIKLVKCIKSGGSLLTFGSGHSAGFATELYHRAGGPSFVIPIFSDFLLPTVGPSIARKIERTPGLTNSLLARVSPIKNDMLWVMSQSGINSSSIDMVLEAKKYGITTVAFTSVVHSKAVKSRHESQKKLFEIADHVIDLGGAVGDACLEVAQGIWAGPLSTVLATTAAHSILVKVMSELESAGISCVYTSVNTPDGEARNLSLEKKASVRDWLLRV